MFGYKAQLAFFKTHNIAIADEQIVQVDQELKFLQPIKAGDTLYCDVYVHSIRQALGTDIIVTKNIITNDKGESRSGDLHDPRGPFGRRRGRWLHRWHCVSSIR